MPNFQFYQLDVFTETPFCGNPLAVFPDGTGISVDKMQQIAREMNLSETVFVLPSDKPEALRRLRIFTPTKELPIAGHPVGGTWNLLARLGFIENAPRDGAIEIQHELGVGVLPVEIHFSDGQPSKVTMTQGKFIAGEVVRDPKILATIAEAFNFTLADFASDAPVQTAGIGVDFTIIPVRSLNILKNCRANSAKLAELPKTFPGEFSLFTRETLEENSTIHTRMFAPEFGITEDPATGSAAGAIGGYLVQHNLLKKELSVEGIFKFTIEQGDFINRPSRIAVEITGTSNNVEKVRVGGAAIIVAKGDIFL
ncbi:MAG: PhzF family phenazine biosynthesis protein [Pyrinomonadaceae bacterium]